MAKECWCGEHHGKGSVRNGDLKHYTLNQKLYQLRRDGKEPKKRRTTK